MEDKFAVSVTAIDTVFLEKFFERIHSIDATQFNDWEDVIEQQRQAREAKEKLIHNGIKEAELQMVRINELLTRTDLKKPLPASLIETLVKQYTGLEAKKAELVQELASKPEEEDVDDVTLYEIRTLIPRIVALWDRLPFEKRLRFVGALVHEIILNRESPGWLTMEIHWKMQGWETDIAYIRRGWCGSHWTPDEDMRLVALFPTSDAGAILQAFPTRGWGAIKQRAAVLHLHRQRTGINSIPVNSPYYLDLCWQDLEYAREHNLVLTTKNAQWWS